MIVQYNKQYFKLFYFINIVQHYPILPTKRVYNEFKMDCSTWNLRHIAYMEMFQIVNGMTEAKRRSM